MRRPPVLGAGLVLLVLSHAASATGQTPPPLSSAAPALHDLGRRVQDASLPEAERVALIRGLGQWGTEQVREPLIAILQDPLPAIREAAARALGWEGNREAAAELRQRLETPGESPAVRAAALESLGRIGDEAVRDAVLAAVDDPDARVRGAALAAVTTGLLARPADRVPLLRRVAEDRTLDLMVRSEAIQELGRAKDRDSQQLLMRLLETERPMPMPLPKPTASQNEVMMLRYRQARDVRAWAAAALGMIEAKEALPLLLKSAEDPDDFFLRVTSVGVLVAWNVPEAVPIFKRRVDDPFPDIRALALAGIAKTADPSMVEAVVMRLSDPAPQVRIEAVGALVALGGSRARTELESLRKRELDARVQQALEVALTRLAP